MAAIPVEAGQIEGLEVATHAVRRQVPSRGVAHPPDPLLGAADEPSVGPLPIAGGPAVRRQRVARALSTRALITRALSTRLLGTRPFGAVGRRRIVEVLQRGGREQIERLRRVGQHAQRGGATDVDRVRVAPVGQDRGDPVEDGDQHSDVPGASPRHQGPQAVLVGLPRAHEARQLSSLRALGGRRRIRGDDLGPDQVEVATRRQGLHVRRRLLVDPVGLLLGQLGRGAQATCPSGEPHPHRALVDSSPQPRVTVTQRHRVDDERLPGLGRTAQQGGQLRSGELRHLRAPVTTELLAPLRSRRPGQELLARLHEVRSVQVGPMCREGHLLGLDRQQLAAYGGKRVGRGHRVQIVHA